MPCAAVNHPVANFLFVVPDLTSSNHISDAPVFQASFGLGVLPLDGSSRARVCPSGNGCFVPPLAVSGPRGVAALVTGSMRAHTVDLEDHEEVEGPEDMDT